MTHTGDSSGGARRADFLGRLRVLEVKADRSSLRALHASIKAAL